MNITGTTFIIVIVVIFGYHCMSVQNTTQIQDGIHIVYSIVIVITMIIILKCSIKVFY